MPAVARQRDPVESSSLLLPKLHFQSFIDLLWSEGYRVIGPTVAQEAITYDEIRAIDDFPRGWTDEQSGGHYRLKRRDDDAWFGFVVGPHSWKRYLFPPRITVATAQRTADDWQLNDVDDDEPPYAFLGVRACELAAIAVQDRTFINDRYSDPIYRRRRERALLIAVNCTQAASTCFCTSMNTGPRCTAGFDLALTELPDAFTVEIGSPRGADLVAKLPTTTAGATELRCAEQARQQAVDQITKSLDTTDIRNLLLGNLDHALDRGRLAVLVVHQLHDGLPDLLLQLGARRERSGWRPCRARARSGTPVSTGTSAT